MSSVDPKFTDEEYRESAGNKTGMPHLKFIQRKRE